MTSAALLLAYDGSAFAGWWRQPGRRTVAAELDAACRRIGEEAVAAIGASRTDAGVHARGQVARLDLQRSWEPEALLRALARQLPADLSCMGVAPVEQTIRNVKLSEQQYDDYARIAGRMTKLRLDAIVGSPDFSTWPANVRQDAVKEVVSQCRETARGIILMQYPQLMTAVRNANLKKHGFEATAQ